MRDRERVRETERGERGEEAKTSRDKGSYGDTKT